MNEQDIQVMLVQDAEMDDTRWERREVAASLQPGETVVALVRRLHAGPSGYVRFRHIELRVIE